MFPTGLLASCTPRRHKGLLFSRTCAVAQNESQRHPDRTSTLRGLLKSPGILLGPCCHDGISARLIERAGFDFAFMSGFCTAAARLGAPDTGLISYAEMVDQGRNIHEATRSIPIIGDGDTGYGNAVNVKRTVKGYAAAGFAGILIEDQVWPKSCGHVRNKRVVPRQEAVARIRAACDARAEGRDILIVARTDARQAESLEEALWRAAAFAEEGADVVFVDALASVEEMRRLCGVAPAAYKMANMLEGGGKTPLLEPRQLEEMGFKLCAYPLSLLGVSVRAMEQALAGLKTGTIPQPPAMPTFQELQEAVGFSEYFAEEARYAVSLSTSPPGSSGGSDGDGDSSMAGGGPAPAAAAAAAAAASAAGTAAAVVATGAAGTQTPVPAAVEADAVVEEGEGRARGSGNSDAARTIDLIQLGSRDDQYGPGDAARQPKSLLVKITNTRTGSTALEFRVPAGFLASAAMMVPQLAGVDLEGLLKQAKGGDWDFSKPVLDLDSGEERVEVFLELS